MVQKHRTDLLHAPPANYKYRLTIHIGTGEGQCSLFLRGALSCSPRLRGSFFQENCKVQRWHIASFLSGFITPYVLNLIPRSPKFDRPARNVLSVCIPEELPNMRSSSASAISFPLVRIHLVGRYLHGSAIPGSLPRVQLPDKSVDQRAHRYGLYTTVDFQTPFGCDYLTLEAVSPQAHISDETVFQSNTSIHIISTRYPGVMSPPHAVTQYRVFRSFFKIFTLRTFERTRMTVVYIVDTI